jgi:hypothetical protein
VDDVGSSELDGSRPDSAATSDSPEALALERANRVDCSSQMWAALGDSRRFREFARKDPHGGALDRAVAGFHDGVYPGDLGPGLPRAFPPTPGWPAGGHRIKAPLEHSRRPVNSRVYGRPQPAEHASPDGAICVIRGNARLREQEHPGPGPADQLSGESWTPQPPEPHRRAYSAAEFGS